ncbi:hypothetical protein GOBAR_AA26080 [Gossypium barbadense]|uniref:Uncharacterized protein n=1 Tax=Gossypium barbadense TaxID=3634 RepID=A0A2P5WU22_GOSBA|nr:hypothetical protein GOBAR_AA26080 [Gossypium barbadense]
MSSSRGKKTTVLASNKRKGAASSSGPTAEIRHPFLKFPLRPQEELFQTLQARPLGTVMNNFDDPGTVQFRLGGLVHQLSILEFRIALGLYTDLVPASATYDSNSSKASALPPSLRMTSEGVYLYQAVFDLIGTTLRAPQHSSTIILPHSHRPDVPTGYLEHAKHEDDQETTWHLPSSVPPRPVKIRKYAKWANYYKAWTKST